MNKFIITLLLTITSIVTFAQNNAESILNKVSKNLDSYQNIEIHFTNTIENKVIHMKQKNEGNAILENNKYVLNYLGNTILFDTKKQYMISPENEEINITLAADLEDDITNPKSMLTFYKKGYKNTLSKKEVKNGKNIQYIKLVPTTKNEANENIAYALLGVDTSNYQIASVKQVGKDGTDTSVNISKYIVNQTLANNTFTFDTAKYEKLDYIINE